MDTTLSQAGEVLHRSEALKQSIQDALSDEVAIIDASGQILAVNEAWRAFAAENGDPGLQHSGPGRNYIQVCRRAADDGSTDAARALAGVCAVLDGSQPEFVMQYQCDSSTENRWFMMTASPLVSELHGALVSHREITVEKGEREAVLHSGHPLSLASVSETYLPALVKNLARSLRVRHAFLCELVAAEPGTVRVVAHWAGKDFAGPARFTAAGTASEQVFRGQFTHIATNLRSRFPADPWLHSLQVDVYIAVPVLDSTGRPLGLLGVADPRPLQPQLFSELMLRLFASRAAPELERRRSEAFGDLQGRLVDSAQDAIVGSDETLKITAWNRAAEVLYGWPAEEVLGRRVPDVLQTHFPDGSREKAVEAVAATGEFRGEVIQRRRDGSFVQIEATTMGFRGPTGEMRGYVSVNRDITERKAAERRLQDALAAKDQFLSLVSHELRSPLTTIMGNSWTLANRMNGAISDDAVEFARSIYEESMRLNGIIENLLMLARLERGESIELGPVRLDEIARRILKRYPVEEREVRLELPTDAPIALGNDVALEQVILNLLSNAEKYSREGSTITLSLTRQGNEAVFAVSDNGRGIPPEALPHLFQPYFRAEEVALLPGMGIGLTVCQRLVGAMEGRIWAANNPEGGARVSFSLPLAPMADS